MWHSNIRLARPLKIQGYKKRVVKVQLFFQLEHKIIHVIMAEEEQITELKLLIGTKK